jgi:hypothetical protein
MAISFNRRINPVIPTTAVTVYNSATLLLVTNEFTNELITPRFVLQIDQSIPFGNVMPTAMSDIDGDKVLMYDRFGTYVRADRLYRALQMRNAGCLPYSGCPNEFQCVVNFDPIRITVLSSLPPSVYCPNTQQLNTTEVTNIDPNGVVTTTTTTAVVK